MALVNALFILDAKVHTLDCITFRVLEDGLAYSQDAGKQSKQSKQSILLIRIGVQRK